MKSRVIAEDNNYIVLYKPAGLATQTAKLGEKDLVSEVKNYLSDKGESPYVAVINRLDQPVEGLVLIGKNEKSAAILSKQLNENRIEKFYEAEVWGHFADKTGKLEDYLIRDGKTNTSKVGDKSNKLAKKALLEYEVTESRQDTDVVRIHLISGRHHQIRVQFSHAGHPLIGDTRYGNEDSKNYGRTNGVRFVALKAYCLSFYTPDKDKKVTYTV